ncbi:alpha/beta hydrolase [Streptomyces sp. NBRC 110611]|uniref:alpha/beta hydrolase n=1 Tax=Streptomyces sp. NBRC 110611 TaxID=1621259 RepID=UPI00099FE948|nr:alpha/beta hydrolase [Streptomyces sp. NBRC 110611]
MAQQALPVREARLGNPLGYPLGRNGARRAVSGVALVLPGGGATGVRRPSPVPALTLRPLAVRLARAGRPEGLTTHVVRYRCRGWNGAAAHPARDATWALDEVVRRYGDVPVCLVGKGMGARAALHAAGHPAVSSVLAIAPWLPDSRRPDEQPDPVKQLIGRQVLLVHGTNDERHDPDLSYRYAQRAKKVNRDICRFEVHSDGHSLHQHRTEVHALAADFLLGSLFACTYSRPVRDALAAPPPLGLRMPLASGFGASLRP